MVGTRRESHEHAGRLRIGVFSNDNWMGWDHLELQSEAHDKARQQAEAVYIGPEGKNFTAFTASIGPNSDEAVVVRGSIAMSFLEPLLGFYYELLAEASPHFAYMEKIRQTIQPFLERMTCGRIEYTLSILVGTIDQVVEKVA